MARKSQEVRRINAWNCPLSKRQVLSIVLTVGDGAVFSLVILPLYRGTWSLVFLLIFTLSFAFTVVAAAWAMTVDPIDPMATEDAPELDEEECDLEDVLHCRYCESHVGLDSKHCKECKKCVANYDHHCPWLNTCIGTRNYGYFYTAIWALLVMLTLLIIATSWLLAKLLRDDSLLSIYGLREATLLAIYIVVIAVNAPWWTFVVALVGFHTYLCYLNITTFEYLTGKVSRRKEEQKLRRERLQRSQARDLWQARLPFDGDDTLSEEEEEEDENEDRRSDISEDLGSPSSMGPPRRGHAQRIGSYSFTDSPYSLHRTLDDDAWPVPAASSTARLEAQGLSVEAGFEEEEASSVDSSSSDEDGDPVGGLFRRIAPREEDSEVKKEFNSFIFGSSVGSVSHPREASSASAEPVLRPAIRRCKTT